MTILADYVKANSDVQVDIVGQVTMGESKAQAA